MPLQAVEGRGWRLTDVGDVGALGNFFGQSIETKLDSAASFNNLLPQKVRTVSLFHSLRRIELGPMMLKRHLNSMRCAIEARQQALKFS